MQNTYIYIFIKHDTFPKERKLELHFFYLYTDTLCHAILIIKKKLIIIYIQRTWHLALRDILINKKLETSKKARQCSLFFHIQNPDTLRYAGFHRIFEIGGGGGVFTFQKCTLCEIFIRKKHGTFCYGFINKKLDTSSHVLIS